MRWQVSAVVVLFLIDRLLKNIIWFGSPHAQMIFFIHPVINKNIAFSLELFGGRGYILTLFICVIIAFIMFETVRLFLRGSRLFFPWGLIMVGAISNALDRFILGGVLDYISIGVFPVFNISDAYITIGITMLLVHEFRRTVDKRKRQK